VSQAHIWVSNLGCISRTWRLVLGLLEFLLSNLLGTSARRECRKSIISHQTIIIQKRP